LRTRAGRELTAIAVHAKAGDDPRSYATRASFAAGLAQDLARRHAASDVVLLGDFNDRFGEGSTLAGSPSPYEPLKGAFAVPTEILERAAERSTAWGETVDHIAVSRSLAGAVVTDSVESLRDELLARHPDFFEAASDHAPVGLELEL
jgi:endonuclease/exonuclease/phosphatase family metal-dependent hydrolase